MAWILRPGVGLARREAGRLQLGADPPLVAVLPDSPAVRLLLVELAHGSPLSALDEETGPALDALVAAGLAVAGEDPAVRRRRSGHRRVRLEVPDSVLPGLLRLMGAAGLRGCAEADDSTVALVWSEGEPPRGRLDEYMRAGTPHLVVREGLGGPVLGPYVVPGRSACLRCVDATLGEDDPRRSLVVEQLATTAPLRPAEPEPALRALAVAWAVRDLTTAADGGLPATWSATVSLAELPPVVTAYRRHLHCGCCWADELVETAG